MMSSWVRGPSHTTIDRRQSESAAAVTEEAKPAGTTEHAAQQAARQGRYPWGSKHIHGTGAGAAAWRAQYPRRGSGSGSESGSRPSE